MKKDVTPEGWGMRKNAAFQCLSESSGWYPHRIDGRKVAHISEPSSTMPDFDVGGQKSNGRPKASPGTA